MGKAEQECQTECRIYLDRFFTHYRAPSMRKSAEKVLRFLAVSDEPMNGKPEGWAAGIIYAIANLNRRACGVPGILNADLEDLFGVTMSTIRKRAAQVTRAIEI